MGRDEIPAFYAFTAIGVESQPLRVAQASANAPKAVGRLWRLVFTNGLGHQVEKSVFRFLARGLVFDQTSDRIETVQRFDSMGEPRLIAF